MALALSLRWPVWVRVRLEAGIRVLLGVGRRLTVAVVQTRFVPDAILYTSGHGRGKARERLGQNARAKIRVGEGLVVSVGVGW